MDYRRNRYVAVREVNAPASLSGVEASGGRRCAPEALWMMSVSICVVSIISRPMKTLKTKAAAGVSGCSDRLKLSRYRHANHNGSQHASSRSADLHDARSLTSWIWSSTRLPDP